MDPATIAITALKASKVAWDIGAQLYELSSSTKVVDTTVRNLSTEATQLGDVCERVQKQLEILAEYQDAGSALRSDLTRREDISLGIEVRKQIHECYRCMETLRGAITVVKRHRSNFFTQTYRQIRLNMNKDEISETRAQIRAHTTHLQISLQLITMTATYLAPKLANQDLLHMIKDLKEAITEQGQKLDESMKRAADDVIACGTTIYEASIAGGSIISDRSGVGTNSRTASWLNQISALGLDPSIGDGSSTVGRAPSILSDFDDARDMPMNGSSIGDGMPVGETSDRDVADDDNLETILGDDFEEIFALETVNTALSNGSQAFEEADYTTASSDLKEALALIAELPMKLRHTCDLAGLRFKLAVCAFYVDDISVAEDALKSVIKQALKSKPESLHLCQAGHLLSQVYIKTSRLDLAASTALDAYRGRWTILGKENTACYESLALLARIYELQEKGARAKTYSTMIPKDVRAQMLEIVSVLHVSEASNASTVSTEEPADYQPSSPLPISKLGSRSSWNPSIKSEVLTFQSHGTGMVRAVHFSSDGQLVAYSRVGAVRSKGFNLVEIGRLVNGAIVKNWQTRGSGLALSPDSKLIAFESAETHAIELVEIATAEIFRTFRGHEKRVGGLAFSPNGTHLVSGSHDCTVRIWDVQTGTETHKICGHLKEVISVAWSPDGKLFSSASEDKIVRLCDAVTGSEVRRFKHKDWIQTVAFSPNSATVASVSDDATAYLWDVATGASFGTFLHDKGAEDVAFSPDGKLLASGSADKSARLFDLSTGGLLQRFEESGRVRSVAFSPDGKLLAVAGAGFGVKIYKLFAD